MNSLSHCNLVHKFIPMPQAMKIPDAKKQQWKNNGKNSYIFASLMDLCHIKNSELKPQIQKYKKSSCAPR